MIIYPIIGVASMTAAFVYVAYKWTH